MVKIVLRMKRITKLKQFLEIILIKIKFFKVFNYKQFEDKKWKKKPKLLSICPKKFTVIFSVKLKM